jgi:hypothetical protein
MYTAYVVITDEVTEAERDEYLRLFSHRPASPGEAAQWLRQWMKETKMKQPDMEELPGFEELFQKTIEAMPLEKRLAGLAPEQVVLALPLELLRAGLTAPVPTFADRLKPHASRRVKLTARLIAAHQVLRRAFTTRTRRRKSPFRAGRLWLRTLQTASHP